MMVKSILSKTKALLGIDSKLPESSPALTKVDKMPASMAGGKFYPPGASCTAEGVHFCVYSFHAVAMDVCLFSAKDASREVARIRMWRDENDFWHAFAPGFKAGTLYGYRAHGGWVPERGQWFNPRKLLLDPYAKAIQGVPNWAPHMQGLAVGEETPDLTDNGAAMLKSVAVDDTFDWSETSRVRVAWKDTVIYEVHVRGFSKSNVEVPEELRGTYAGLAHPASIAYLKNLGVTTVQLMPVHAHLDDSFLLERDLTNYWGYNTIGFFAPHSEYACGSDPLEQINEFKGMVKILHRAGIEVILDVVYNHTAEGSEQGASLFLRGLDNSSYYLLNHDGRTMNYTGCGNTVNAASPASLRLIMDSLRYWVEHMHIDGFRFDLGTTLGRNGEDFNRDSAFFLAVAQDPLLSRVKMITEPWDIGPNGYQVGGFPKPWHELNGRYRDTVRRFWCGDNTVLADFAKRFCGSQDIFGPSGRLAAASINFITSHDGFTLRDLWTYNEKHNEANGEGNRDGDNQNHSWNCGVEGESEDADICALRRKLTRSMLATMFLSAGVPFITAGDERWRTQKGNNNAYCQDNDISWMDWAQDEDSTAMLDFTTRLVQLRKRVSAFHRRYHYNGKVNPLTGHKDIDWFDTQGQPMTSDTWHHQGARFFAALIDNSLTDSETSGAPAGMLWLLFNGSDEEVIYPLSKGPWTLALDTSLEGSPKTKEYVKTFACAPRSVACLVLNIKE